MYITVLFVIAVLLIVAIWELASQKGSSHIKKHNERLPEEIKQIKQDFRIRQRSSEMRNRITANRLQPLNDRKRTVESRIRQKVDSWMRAIRNRPNQ